MGILAENLVWLRGFARPQCSMLELGSQYLYIAHKPFLDYPERFLNPSMQAAVYSKPYFQEEMGIDHVSIDLNGHGGSLPLDLTQPQNLGREFDVVTDFGTSEHVSDLWACLENVHRHARNGGVIIHVNPLAGNWPGHGTWYRDEAFYRAYAEVCKYSLLDLHRTAACENIVDGWNICAVLGKNSSSTFPDRDTFYKLPLKNK